MSSRSLLRLTTCLVLVLVGLVFAPWKRESPAPRIASAASAPEVDRAQPLAAPGEAGPPRAPAPRPTPVESAPAESAAGHLDPDRFEVLVLDDAGRALRGAWVELRWSKRAREHGTLEAGATNSEGRWRATAPMLEHWPTIELQHLDLQLRASAPGHRPESIDLSVLDLRDPQRRLELRLSRGASIRGRVVDERGHPVENAFAFVGLVTEDPPGTGNSGQLDNDQTDRTGAFELRLDIDEGPLWLEASRLGTGYSSLEFFDLAQDAGSNHVLCLKEGRALRGRVVYPDGSPAPRVALHANPVETSDHIGVGWTDADGRFRVPGLRDMEYTLSLDAWPSGPQGAAPRRFRPPLEGITLVTRQCGVTVQVRGPDGALLNGVQVWILLIREHAGTATLMRRDHFSTGGDPPAALLQLDPGSSLVFRVELDGCHATQVAYRAPDVLQRDLVELQLYGRDRLARVRPTFPEGRLAPGVDVRVDVYDPWTRLYVARDLEPDADGLLPGLAPGRWILFARRAERPLAETLPANLGTQVDLRPDREETVWLTFD